MAEVLCLKRAERCKKFKCVHRVYSDLNTRIMLRLLQEMLQNPTI